MHRTRLTQKWSQESTVFDDTSLCDVGFGDTPCTQSIDTSCTWIDPTSELGFHSPLETRKMIKDSVHGCIYLEPLCMAIIDTVHFQRLRHLKQLGASYFVYMSATHSRFEHSVGVAHLAELMLSQLRQHQPWLGITDQDILCVKIAGLCHDLGHGPFSHVFDGIFMQQLRERGLSMPQMNGWTHEKGSLDVLSALLSEYKIDVTQYGLQEIDVKFIQELIVGHPLPSCSHFCGRPTMPYLYEVVNNAKTGLDVDKLDYFMRDAQYTGAKASCDTHLLLSTMRVLPDAVTGELTMCWPDKMAEQIMKVFRTRYDLHQAVYQHKATRAIEYMICDILLEADMAGFQIQGARIAEAPLYMNVYKRLDDRVLALIESSDDPRFASSRAILTRLATKPLYKWVGTTQVTARLAARSESQIKSEIAAVGHLDPRHLIVEKNRVHFGHMECDPMQAMRFFRKHATPASVCFQLNKATYAMHCPKYFMESNVRLFVRDVRYAEAARQAFATWAERQNESALYPQEL
ncbi:hypothetical protein, variant 3 [Aphanomyces invadans]|uniref:HD domain-containing protein n=1 Tax=Aphanomyces invadans TaxID=157072 RepID=A0A024TUH2_9STRA|nr:hypothetical protein, variant 2 [Aphanomyces invadans]XP_008873977.1 hypothetical protein, variant 3 [Aphanomyces invadans]XP_008873979.1 hypothetical protein, variant 1 [Aphanomyces invadans]ETV97269.1 hypothetical protein, variant 1 [Aphanomyces invadans]ETV97270.1 hypothetical protein, variant 2 [Aphanomyces invadans]ETV97271.1 hypothetical protein, variant 3 [Aphanomyces invadans]|eukprot:XP_008873976.1 hypothetical protein, variant 2 [Aphanomyces invadans]